MKIVSLLAQKGGVGKTTLTLHWAVEAVRQGYGDVAVIDMDMQQSAAKWSLRRSSDTPVMLQADETNIGEAVKACRTNGFDLVLIDTMPRVEASSVEAAKVADLSIIPCGPSVLDIEAIGATIEITTRVKTPGVIVINQGRHSSNINDKAAAVLAQYELPLCPVKIMHRAALEDAFIDGRAVAELKPRSKAAHEIAESWTWIVKQLEA